jgi:hypothetical protein
MYFRKRRVAKLEGRAASQAAVKSLKKLASFN